jgi:hypothetical protein
VRDLLVIVPSRGRPDRLAAMLAATLGLSGMDTDVAVCLDDDDVPPYEQVSLDTDMRVSWHAGPRDTVAGWTNTVAAAQAGYYRALASLSDDHVPRTPGWDRLLLGAIDGMGGTGFAYGDDLLQGEIIPTAVVVSSDIVRALGWMCEPAHRHYWIDNVWKDLGQGAGCLAYVPGVVIEHCHPGVGKGAWDATYAAEAARDGEDEAAYREWRAGRMAGDVATVAGLRKGNGCGH